MNVSSELLEIRDRIDILDEQIVPLLVERTNLALKASDYKTTEKQIRGDDGNRVNEVLEKVEALAKDAGGHESTIRVIYSVMIEELTKLQLEKKGL